MTTLIDTLRGSFAGELREQEPLSRHTSLRVGGPADFFAVPRDSDDLATLLRVLDEHGVSFLVVGGGYNLLVRDGGFRGAVISLEKFQNLAVRPFGEIRAEAGGRNIDLARLAEAHGLSGFEYLVGIPGTVGGALRMNAGAHGGEIFDHLVSLELTGPGGRQQLDKKTLNYGYRRLQLEPNKIIIAANFQLSRGSREEISAAMDSCLQKRRETQQVRFPNAGSYFKNPPGRSAWKLIDDAGLRGYTVGGAQVSDVHTNFLVNRGGATASDILGLAAVVKEKVAAQSGIILEEEVRIVGED